MGPRPSTVGGNVCVPMCCVSSVTTSPVRTSLERQSHRPLRTGVRGPLSCQVSLPTLGPSRLGRNIHFLTPSLDRGQKTGVKGEG